MIQINKVGNAIVIKFTDNDKYLFNGTIEVAPNELMVVVDQSNMVTFKKMSNGDTLFGQSYEKIRINDEPVTKENIVEKFATIGFTSGGGGGTGGAVDSVNGQTGTVIITAASIGAMTKETADATYQPIGDYAVKSDLSTLATKAELNNKLDTSVYEVDKPTFALKSELSDLVTTEQLNTKQDTLVSGTNIKTINGQTLLGEGNIEIQGGGTITVDSELSTTSENPVQNKVITNAINGKQDAGDYALKSEIPDTSELATKEELAAKLDTATYNVDKPTFALKTEIPDISGLATKTELSGKLDTATYNSEKASFETKENAAATYQVKGDYATTAQLNSKQDTLVSGTNIKTINGNSLLGEGDITIQAGGTVDTAMSDTSENAVQNKVIKKYIDDLVGNILTQLQEINGTN